jgi:hypothetical protein
MRELPALFYVLERDTGKKILVTEETRHQYRDSVKYIQLDEPVPADTPNPVSKATKKSTAKSSSKASRTKKS